MSEDNLENLEKSLDLEGEFDDTDVSLSEESMELIRQDTRRRMVVEFQQTRVQMKLMQKIGNEDGCQRAEAAAKDLLKMIKAIDDKEV
jgi:hypothetical protein